jgi:hypothetical protein
MSTSPQYDPEKGNAWTRDLPAKLQSHLAQMAPHQKERESGKLLMASAVVLAAARAAIDAGRPHGTRGFSDALPDFTPCHCSQCLAWDALKKALEA